MVLFAGEVVPDEVPAQLMELLPHARFAQPLRADRDERLHVVRGADGTRRPGADAIPIGRAIADVEAYRRGRGRTPRAGRRGRRALRARPHGDAGLLGRPRADRADARLDAARRARTRSTAPATSSAQDPDGDLLFLGRRDAQIKSRGYRIELGEIETALNAHPVVVGVRGRRGARRARDEPDQGLRRHDAPVAESELVEHCRARLPRYMVPESFELRDELPKTSTGKIARKLL